MREVLSFFVGQCGCRLGNSFMERVFDEHGICPNGEYVGDSDVQLEKVDVYFSERRGGRFSPRAIFADLDPMSMDEAKGTPFVASCPAESLIEGKNSTSSNFGRGHYTDGAEMTDQTLDVVRKQVEECESLQGFQLCHAVAGGTGSGFGTLMLQKLREEYPDAMLCTYSVLPSPLVSDSVVEPYNATLALHHIIDEVDMTFCFDNEALVNMCVHRMQVPSPTYADMNHFLSVAMSGVTCTMRFPGRLNTDLLKLATNLIPYPRLHFLTCSASPLFSRGSSAYHMYTVPELCVSLFDGKHMMHEADPRTGRCLAASVVFRGRSNHQHRAEDHLQQIINNRRENFCEWIPDSVKSTTCDIPIKGLRLSAAMVCNNTNISSVFRRINDQFSSMYARKAFLHWFTAVGMDEMEFTVAGENMKTVISEYQQLEETWAGGSAVGNPNSIFED